MKVFINVKRIDKRRAKVGKIEYSFEKTPETLRELILGIVSDSVDEYNRRFEASEPKEILSEEEISDMSVFGKIAFGINYGEKKADKQKAFETAISAFEDGLFRVFIGETEAEKLDDKIEITEGDEITFISFTMLAGRLW